MWRSLGVFAAVAVLVTAVLWWTKVGAGRTDGAPLLGTTADSAGPAADPTDALGQAVLAFSGAGRDGQHRALYDPVVIGPCNLAPVDEQEVSSQLDGILKEVKVELGQQVQAGGTLGRLDDWLQRPQVEMLKLKAASEAVRLIAKAQYDDAQSKIDRTQRLVSKSSASASELESYQFQRQRFAEEMKKADEDQEFARKELEKALRTLQLHEIRSVVTGEVTKVYKRAGEAVRQTEPLFCVANFNRLRAEGPCKVQQANLLRVGMKAVVEPELRGEQMTELAGHTGTVTDLAVSGDGRLLASASEDRTVLLWAWPQGARLALLRHPAEVHAVAFAPASSPEGRGKEHGHLLLTGCADARARLWTVSAGGKVEGPVVLPGGHDGPVRAVAFSPDGRWCATAGEDKQIGIWDVAAGQRLYWLQANSGPLPCAHQGAVTSLHFTPDGQLVSAGRDNALKVWKLTAEGGQLAAVLPGRTGGLSQLGLSPDGRRLLFEHGDELRILAREDGSSTGSLRSRKQGRFQAFAHYSPSGTMVLTGANNGRIQLWKAPASPEEVGFFRQGYVHGFRRSSLLPLGALDGTPLAPAWAVLAAPLTDVGPDSARKNEVGKAPELWSLDGYEVRHFLMPNPSAVTCGAFAPDESVVFTGGADRLIRVWEVPGARQWAHPIEAEITYVGSQVERGSDTVRVRAELENPQGAAGRLRPGTYVTLRIYPETAPSR